MKKFSLLSTLLLTACVTINIYFPAAAAEKVADEIIKGIQDEVVQPSEPEAGLNQSLSDYRWVDGVLDLFISSAHAAEADLDIDTAEIRKLRANMKSRFAKLKPFYEQGLIGVDAEGLVAIIDAKKVPLKDRNTIKKLVAAENQDREALYTAIANANGHPEWRNQIEDTFAARWLSNVKSGWWYQTKQGAWKQK